MVNPKDIAGNTEEEEEDVHVVCHVVHRDLSAIDFERLDIAFTFSFSSCGGGGGGGAGAKVPREILQ